MENGAISDEQITASTQWHVDEAAFRARLHLQETLPKSGGWVTSTNDANQWLQIDLRSLYTKVKRVATQGRNRNSAYDGNWVTNYMLQYGNDGVSFSYYREQGQTANKVKQTFKNKVSRPYADRVRYLPSRFGLFIDEQSITVSL